MSEMQPNDYPNDNVSDKILFCRKCGHKLTENSESCSECGTPIKSVIDVDLDKTDAVMAENSQTSVEKQPEKNKIKHIGKTVLISLSSLILIAAIIVGGLFFWKTRVIKQDINLINGCPELFNIRFGMTADEASNLIKIKHETHPGIESPFTYANDDYSIDAYILFDPDDVFYLFGRKTSGVYVGFDINSVDRVLIGFSEDDYNLNDIVSLYKKIYDEPTESGNEYATWIGPKTTIDVYEHVPDDGSKKEIVAYYSITANAQYSSLHFDGTELDPCGLWGEHSAFNNKPDYYIDGLKEGHDYFEETSEPSYGFPGFTEYTLCPQFEYMGIEKGFTAIQFSKESDKEYIGLAGYMFLLEKNNVVDRMTYIHSKLVDEYGVASSSTYTPFRLDGEGIKDISFDEMIERITNDVEGMYHVQWENNGQRITLGLTISEENDYYEGTVALAKSDS